MLVILTFSWKRKKWAEGNLLGREIEAENSPFEHFKVGKVFWAGIKEWAVWEDYPQGLRSRVFLSQVLSIPVAKTEDSRIAHKKRINCWKGKPIWCPLLENMKFMSTRLRGRWFFEKLQITKKPPTTRIFLVKSFLTSFGRDSTLVKYPGWLGFYGNRDWHGSWRRSWQTSFREEKQGIVRWKFWGWLHLGNQEEVCWDYLAVFDSKKVIYVDVECGIGCLRKVGEYICQLYLRSKKLLSSW